MATTSVEAPLPSNEVILKSKLSVYESEIVEFKKKIEDLTVDLNEGNASLKKISEELKKSQHSCTMLKKENVTLQKTVNEYKKIQQLSSSTNTEQLQTINNLQIEKDEMKNENKELKTTVGDLRKGIEIMQNKQEIELSTFKKENAKLIGKMKNKHQQELEERINSFAKEENNIRSELSNANNRIDLMDREYKDTIASQAQRLTAYEQQLNMMDKEIVRLKLQKEYQKMPKMQANRFTETEMERLTNENNTLRHKNQEREREITQLSNRLNMFNINRHHDFRHNGTLF